ncbi:MAG: hypothetical protein PUI84_05455 [Bacteroidales bacterium]|nr:hypothetical protein [Porphyromonas sp.]MDD6934749.1 hypothetical protein [Bacteroidales bacterium]MDY3102761.1 hypothetical protein [Porphyromonas sp.]
MLPRAPRRKLSKSQVVSIVLLWLLIAGWMLTSIRLDIFAILGIIFSGIGIFATLYKHRH